MIKALLKNESALHEGVEVIVHLICVAAIKVSIESVAESLVSRYETHFNSSRQSNELNSLEEMIISEKGPLLQHADPILEKAMSLYWKNAGQDSNGEWHFLRKSNDIRSYTGGSSKVVGKLLDAQSKLSFMDV